MLAGKDIIGESEVYGRSNIRNYVFRDTVGKQSTIQRDSDFGVYLMTNVYLCGPPAGRQTKSCDL